MYEAAANATEKYLESDPKNFVAQMSLALTYSFLNRQEDSIKAANRAIEIEPNNAHAYKQRGVSNQVLGHHEKAIDDFKKSIELDPNQSGISRCYVLIADSLCTLRNYEEAVNLYNKGVEIDPCDAAAWYGLGFCHTVLSQLQKASEYYEKAIKLNPNYFEAYRDLASVYEKLSLYDLSVKNAIKAMQLNLKGVLPTICLNAWGYNLSNYAGSLESYISGETEEPNDEIKSLLYYCLGESNVAIRNAAKAREAYQKAQELYKKLLKANPSDAYALWGLSSSYYGLKEYENAIESYLLAIKSDPNFTASYAKLAFLYATCPKAEFRNGPEAAKLARKACELTEYESDVCLAVLAAVYAETGDFDKAVEYQKKAIDLADDSAKKEYEKRLEAYEAKKPWRE
jgi:tetratricopeptide (TPR) repeat protein